MLPINLNQVRRQVRESTTEDLLDRVTVYRNGMEPEALEILERELRERGLDSGQIEEHARSRGSVLQWPDGTARSCAFCRRPAVVPGWGWQRLWGIVPVFPRRFCYCDEHRPRTRGAGC